MFCDGMFLVYGCGCGGEIEKKDEIGDGDVVNIFYRCRWEEDDGRWEWDGLGVGE